MSKPSSILVIIFLCIASFAGNYFNLSLFFGVDFLFGSIFALLALYYYGKFWGAIAAFIGGSYTYFLWGHPYACLIFTGEAIFVGAFLRRRHQSLVLLVTFYWSLIGMAAVALFYGLIMQVPPLPTGVIIFKQSVNAIFNSVVATIIITYLPSLVPIADSPKISLRETLFNLLVTFVVFSSLLLTVFQANQSLNQIKSEIIGELNDVTPPLTNSLENWYREHLNQLSLIANKAASLTETNSQYLQNYLDNFQTIYTAFSQIYLSDQHGKIIAASPLYDQQGRSLLRVNIEEKLGISAIADNHSSKITQIYQDVVEASPRLGIKLPITGQNQFQGLLYAILNLEKIKDLLSNSLNPQGVSQAILVDEQQRIIASTRQDLKTFSRYQPRQNGEINELDNQTFQWLPISPGTPIMVRWKNSFYIREVPVDFNPSWQLFIRIEIDSYIEFLELIYFRSLSFVFLVIIISVFLSNYLSKKFVAPLLELAQTTSNIPEKMLKQEIKFINNYSNHGLEIDILDHNFKIMIRELTQQFSAIQEAKQNLEARVKTRTEELTRVNQDLALEIKQRQAIEADLRESKRRYDLAVSGTNDGVWDWNICTGDVYYSPAFLRILGYDKAKDISSSIYGWSRMVHPDDLQNAIKVINEHLEGKTEVYSHNYRLRTANNSYIWVAAKGISYGK